MYDIICDTEDPDQRQVIIKGNNQDWYLIFADTLKRFNSLVDDKYWALLGFEFSGCKIDNQYSTRFSTDPQKP